MLIDLVFCFFLLNINGQFVVNLDKKTFKYDIEHKENELQMHLFCFRNNRRNATSFSNTDTFSSISKKIKNF
jgi:hypothetical protein